MQDNLARFDGLCEVNCHRQAKTVVLQKFLNIKTSLASSKSKTKSQTNKTKTKIRTKPKTKIQQIEIASQILNKTTKVKSYLGKKRFMPQVLVARALFVIIFILAVSFSLINAVVVYEVRFEAPIDANANKSGVVRNDYALSGESAQLSCHFLMKDDLEDVKQVVWSKDGKNVSIKLVYYHLCFQLIDKLVDKTHNTHRDTLA